jgi:hypothetical protein
MSRRAEREQAAVALEWVAASTAKDAPCLCLTRVSVDEMLSAVRAEHFPDLAQPVSCLFVPRGMLAWVEHGPARPARIYIHEVLNSPAPPPELFSLILKHELLHLTVAPRVMDGTLKQHPPEFWEAERRIAPEGDEAWAWLWRNLGQHLRREPDEQGIRVLRTWKRHVWGENPVWVDSDGRVHIAPDRREGW